MRMVIFLSVFITLYGFLHFLAFRMARRAFGFHKRVGIPLGLFMGFMVACPILVRVMERQGFESSIRVLAYAGYTWMGFLFLFLAAGLILDLYGVVVYFISRVTAVPGANGVYPPESFFLLHWGPVSWWESMPGWRPLTFEPNM